MRNRLLILLSAALLPAACGGGPRRTAIVVEQPRLTSILVEVYDPLTNFAWEGVSVRVVEADQEWSGCTCVSPYLDWLQTDAFGRVLIDEYVLGDADVGFFEDSTGAAVLSPAFDEDEALVVLEIDAIGFAPTYVEVPLSWNEPDVFVEVPFF